jgi:hypothetical protein
MNELGTPIEPDILWFETPIVVVIHRRSRKDDGFSALF